MDEMKCQPYCRTLSDKKCESVSGCILVYPGRCSANCEQLKAKSKEDCEKSHLSCYWHDSKDICWTNCSSIKNQKGCENVPECDWTSVCGGPPSERSCKSICAINCSSITDKETCESFLNRASIHGESCLWREDHCENWLPIF
jgi:hypothetical protein